MSPECMLINGVSTRNKGAELMFIAVRQHYSSAVPSVNLAVDQWFGSFDDRCRYGLRTFVRTTHIGRSAVAVALMPRNFRSAFGLLRESDFTAVIDASGFAFSDRFGPRPAEGFAARARRWKSQGKKIVLLPQALGPFEDMSTRRAFRRVMELSDLVFARDPDSFEYAKEVCGSERLHMAPDFTGSVLPKMTAGAHVPTADVLIVPNRHMVESTGRSGGEYIPFLASAMRFVEGQGKSVAILLHESVDDAQLAERIQKEVGREVRIIADNDPLVLKASIGNAQMLIGSRYHALASALTQGVPVLATGWAHKYKWLLKDYGCENCLVELGSSFEEVREVISRLLENTERSRIVQKINKRGVLLEEQTKKMWRTVDTTLGID